MEPDSSRSLHAILLFVGLAGLTGAACGAPDADGGDTGGQEAASRAVGGAESAGAGSILRADPRFDDLVPDGATIERVAGGFEFTEGPVWLPDEERLLFSDIPANAIYQWSEADSASVFLESLYEGDREGLIGSNGLTLDPEGRLIICEHGNRRISRLEEDGSRTVLVDSYRGRRLNSPNDAVYRSDGWLYFTDPPYGLQEEDDSPLKELDFNGIYRLSPDGELELLSREQSRPNGIAFSPDERTLYVANSDAERLLWMAYDVGPDGLSNARVFYDATGHEAEGSADGMTVDRDGNVFATGPGGVWVFAPDGTHLGTIQPDEIPANAAWGDDGHTLYMTARTGLYRIRLSTRGRIP